ncbi:MAG: hypothetical protein LQ344_003184 [Seirophora lacunosa]|nr:MAG: hypothetical protein LQ344_003184 [Seirophora lacunosa]
MFLLGAPATTALRNPRRRQRTGSEDSGAVRRLSKRLKRSGFTSETFKPLQNTSANGELCIREPTPSVNGLLRDIDSGSPATHDHASLAIRNRGGKNLDRETREHKSDGSVELTRNDTYSVSRLATTPAQFQSHRGSVKWQGQLAPGIGYAVATTQVEALVWRYKQGANASDASKPLIIRLPHAAPNAKQPLPLALLVPSSPEPGLLIVRPVSGKITYWETLSSAANVDLNRQKQQAIQGTIVGLASGEHATNIIEAEPQGFLITINSGKIAHLSIADPDGKASISAQILRDTRAHDGGIFGSLRNVFGGGGSLRNVAAVKASNTVHKGQRGCIIGTSRGLLQLWELNWNLAHSLKYEVDIKAKLLDSIYNIGVIPCDRESQRFGVLDFVILPSSATGQELISSGHRSITKLLVLTVASAAGDSRYTLHVVEIADGTVDIPVVHPISCYTTPTSLDSSSKPTLLVPNQSETAYVIFEEAVVLVSLEEVPDSPDSQLRTETAKAPDQFQDVIDFHKEKGYRVVGCAVDIPEKGYKGSACTVMVQGYGLIKVSVAPLEEGLTFSERATITAQTKLEQAVFYGPQQSLLDFSGRPEVQFATEEVEDAAIRISRSIASSSSMHLSTAGPSTEQHLQRRATALSDLIKHLSKHYQPMRPSIRWKLLWEAEKMAAAKAIWRCYCDAVASKPKEEKVLLHELVECISEQDKTENQPDEHETDPVRHWLVHDVWQLQILLPWVTKALNLLYEESLEDNMPMSSAYRARLISEAHDLQLVALQTAYGFRQDNTSLYGLSEDTMMLNVPIEEGSGMPEIWTSTPLVCEAVRTLAEHFQEFVTDLDSHNSSDEEGNSAPQKLLEKTAQSNARLVDMTCKIHTERVCLLQADDNLVVRQQGQELERLSNTYRRDLLRGLVNIGLYHPAIKLGEKYGDMEALAEVLESEIQTSQEDLDNNLMAGEETDEVCAKIALCQGFVDKYFVKYGESWANAFFARFVDQGRISQLLVHGPKQRMHMTSFLRSHPECAAFSWINEVAVEGNFAAAADDLGRAQKQADTVWAKKVQLSMSKLATLAAVTNKQRDEDLATLVIHHIDCRAEVLDAQEQLYEYLKPTMRRALNDTPAKVDVVMEQYFKRFVKAKKALRSAMKINVKKIAEEKVLDVEDLVDTISLMDEDGLDPDGDFAAGRFLTAIKLVRSCIFETGEVARRELMEKIIWRRCIIQDNWSKINRTEKKGDAQVEAETVATALFKTLREGFKSSRFHARDQSLTLPTNTNPDVWDDYPPLKPSSLLGSGTTVGSLRASSRYDLAPDNALEVIARDLSIEDGVLQICIGEGRLEKWWSGIIDAARMSVRNEADRVGEDNSRRRETERGFRNQMNRDHKALWGVNTTDGDELGLDEEGDVTMGI